MSCNGCRALRKGCSDDCMLRHCLQWIGNPEAQANATVFVAKFYGRAGLMSFISSVPPCQRPALFQSLLFEAVGRGVNPVGGAVGLVWTGNFHVCQLGVETVLRGGTLSPFTQYLRGCSDHEMGDRVLESNTLKRKFCQEGDSLQSLDLDLCLVSMGNNQKRSRAATPSEGSQTTTMGSGIGECSRLSGKTKLLTLFP